MATEGEPEPEELRKSTLNELLLEDDDDDFAYEEVDVDVDAEEELDDAASEDLEAALRSLQATMGHGTTLTGALSGAPEADHAEPEPGEVTRRPEVRCGGEGTGSARGTCLGVYGLRTRASC